MDEVARTVAAALAPGVLVAAAAPDRADAGALLPAERRLLDGVAPRRAAELATGRRLARGLLADPSWALLPDRDRVPVWPPGVTGSIAHCDACCVVAVLPDAADGVGLGVDVEPDVPLEPELWPLLLAPSEWGEVDDGGDVLRRFCAKEAAYKARFPVERRWREPGEVVAHRVDDRRYVVDGLAVEVVTVGALVLATARTDRRSRRPST